MTEPATFHIDHSVSFEQDIRRLLKRHYRKDPGGARLFTEGIAALEARIAADPRIPQSDLEPWPDGVDRRGLEFRKLRFRMPRLGGAAGQGRLMYLVDWRRRRVRFVLLYTHAEYEKRPDEKDLKQSLRDAIQS